VPDDHEVIHDDDALLRRVRSQPAMVRQTGDRLRPSSAAFKPSTDGGGVSVDVRRLLPDRTDPTSVLAERPSDGLAEVRAATVRGCGLDVLHDPTEGNVAHANIVGLVRLSKSLQKRARRTLAEACVWVREPSGGEALGG